MMGAETGIDCDACAGLTGGEFKDFSGVDTFEDGAGAARSAVDGRGCCLGFGTGGIGEGRIRDRIGGFSTLPRCEEGDERPELFWLLEQTTIWASRKRC